MPKSTQCNSVQFICVVCAVPLLVLTASENAFVGMGSLGARHEQPMQNRFRDPVIVRASIKEDQSLNENSWFICNKIAAFVTPAIMAAIISFTAASSAQAFFGTGNSGEVIGEIGTNGMLFKDTINVERITDPKVSGVTIYQTDFSKSSFDKLKSGNILQADPSSSGLACTVDGKVLAKSDVSKDKAGEEIFSESKAFVGKSLKVTRIVDGKSKNLVYVVYTDRLNKDDDPNGSRFKSQACAIHIDNFV